MFKKSRQKIVAVIMVTLIALLGGTLCVIYVSSYAKVYQKNQNMLAHHIELSSRHDFPDLIDFPKNVPNPNKNEPPFDDAVFRLSTFYLVVLDNDNNVLKTNNISTIYTDDELENIAIQVVDKKNNGTYGNLVYRYEQKDGYFLVAFMDNTIMHESITTLFRYTLLFGIVATILIFFLARHAAKRIVQPLEESYRKQKQFISDAGHELKTPVSVVSANTEMLERQIGKNQWLSNIQHENARMGELVTLLLELARTEQITPEMSEVDFSRIVMGEVLPFETVAFENGLTLQSRISEQIMLEGNAQQLSQLVSILLDNAIYHSKADYVVQTILQKERDTIQLSVINEGTPIEEEQKNLLFERFYRGDEARTDDGNRYGLGLAIAKAIVAAHKGKIDVKCHNGLVEFCVTLPSM